MDNLKAETAHDPLRCARFLLYRSNVGNRLADARATLARAIVADMGTDSGRRTLEAGWLTPAIDSASRLYSATRAGSAPRRVALTETLKRWQRAVCELQRGLGRDPTCSELAAYTSTSKSGAASAMVRLRRIGEFPSYEKQSAQPCQGASA